MSNLIKQSVKKTGRARKEVLVAELTEKLDSANGLVFSDYQGLTHKQLEELKKELRKLDAKIFIAKNSLLKLALDKSKNFKDAKDNDALKGPIATLFIEGEMIEPLKRLQKSIKSYGKPSIKFGILEGSTLDADGVLKIASLPGRETLLAQLLMLLNSPIQGFTSGLNAVPQKFVMTLDAIAKSKPSDTSSKDVSPADNAPPADQTTPMAESEEKPSKGKDETETPVKKEGKPDLSAEASSKVEATPETSKSKEENPEKDSQGGDK